MRKVKRSRYAITAFVVALVLAAVGPVMAFAALQTNYNWYKGHESDSEYVLKSAGELKALANLVNGTAKYDEDGDGKDDSIAAVSFQGKKITLNGVGSANFLGEAIVPIGTAQHPFQGAFDGSAQQVDNFKLVIAANDTAPVTNIGLFGYVGDSGSLTGVSVGKSSSIAITRSASSKDYIANIGMVAGYCAGTMADCSNAGTLTVESAVVQQSKDDYLPVRNIGGVVGQCVYDVTNCSNTGNVTVRETSSPVASFEHAQLAARIGGVAGLLGDEARIGDYDTHIFGEASKHGSIDSCTNIGTITVDTPKVGGLDRFGVQTSAESVYVGGVVGYSQGSVTNCVNGRAKETVHGTSDRDVGYVNAGSGVMVGGVCGSLRGVLADNTNIAWADDGADGNDPLTMSHCTNYGDVYARVTAGGIVGKAGSYTTIAECLTANKRDYDDNEVPTYVVATRWNKPGPGGVVGTANGSVSYCANFATIASGVWKDESVRTISTQDGYYVAGIVGMLTYFDDQAVAHGQQATPVPEVFSCFNAGDIIAGANMRQRGIVGENNGYVFDNVLLAGVVSNDDVVYGDEASENEASGTVGENRVYTAKDLHGAKAAEAVAFLNKNSEANGWQRYWILPRDASADGLNAGYPLLDSQDPWGSDKTSVANASVSLAADAPYTGGESTPSAAVTLDGLSLTENADYYVVPQAQAIEPSTGKKYRASVVGLGRYSGTATQKFAYDIVAGDFGKCTLTVASHTFDYKEQFPNAEDVTIRTQAGTVVPSDEYTLTLVDDAGDEIAAPVDVGAYKVKASPKASSKLFTGSKEGVFRVKPASFMREVSFDDVKISYLGKEYSWVDSKKIGETDNPTVTLRYAGAAVKPIVGEITYEGHTLVEGKDYRVVYGNANSDDGWPDDLDENNAGKKGGKSIGCVTVRYISGQVTNFTSYANMFFNIVDDGSKIDLSNARVPEIPDQIYDGQPIEPVELWLDNAKLTEGTDYTIEYSENHTNPGTVAYLATGRGQFTGTKSGTFTILEGSVYDLSFDFAGTGTADNPYEATVTGVEYRSNRDAFSMVIPESVKHDGHVYAVTAIGDSAFGGSKVDDFQGSLANESKMKISSVFIPATVRRIGNFAFGTSVLTLESKPALESVEFGSASQLESIGEYAFAQCANLASFTFPENVASIGDFAFEKCSSLTELRFPTDRADMPQSVSLRAFSSCKDVVVRGFENATAVKKVAQDNKSKNFTFVAINSLAGAELSQIPEQIYTGAAIRPSVTVKLDGKKLTEGVNYTVSYENNVDSGTARAVVSGIGAYGGQTVREFSISPADIGLASFVRIADQSYTGQPVALKAKLSFKGRALQEGVDYELSYADASGNVISAPFAAGSYRLVVAGKGNFNRETYRAFSIVAPQIEDSSIGAIGNQVFTGMACEPDPTVTVAGKQLERDVDYTLSFENNLDVGQGIVHVFGIGSYSGEAQAKFPIIAASLADATVAGVRDMQATGSPVTFDPVVIVDGKRLVEGVDYTLSFADSNGQALTAQSEDTDEVSGEEEAEGQSGEANLVEATRGMAPAAGEAGLIAQDLASASIEGAPSAAGSYKLVVTGVGNYSKSISVDFRITSGAPSSKTDVSAAVLALSDQDCTYDGTAHKPAPTLTLGGSTLREGVDYIVSYSDNVSAGSASATAYGIGDYAGSITTEFRVAAAVIGEADVSQIPTQEYAASAIKPHLVIGVSGRSLVEGIDYTVEYGANLNPGTGSVTVTGKAPNCTGSVTRTFNIVKADVSGALVSLEYDSAVYSGKPLTPKVTVTHHGRKLDSGTEYDVSYADNSDVGTATVTVTGKGSYCTGKTSVSFTIAPKEVARPSANTGLVYTGGSVAGVTPKAGLSISGGSAVKAGTYTAQVKPAAGYVWPGGFKSTISLTYTIAPASIAKAKVTFAKTSLPYTGKAQKPAVKSVKLGTLSVPASGYSTAFPTSKKCGTYKVKLTGKGNFTGSVTATYKIVPAAQKLSVKAKAPSARASQLKKSKKVLKLANIAKVSGAKTTVTYAKTKGSSPKLSVNKKTGALTIAKGTKAGTYKLVLKVSAAKTVNYKAASKTATVKLTVK